MDSTESYLSDKFLYFEDASELEKGRDLPFFKFNKKSKNAILDEFQILNQISMTEEHEKLLAKHQKGKTAHLNRYSDILPYKYSVVQLDTSDHADANSYINANYIPTPFCKNFNSHIITNKNCDENDLSFIACQGPKSNTVEDFWRMVKQQNIGVIVMLCRVTEGGRSKCEEYWPAQGEAVSYSKSGIHVACDRDESETENLHYRDITLTFTDSEESIKVKQIQYSGWPDHGVPQESALEDFDKLMEFCTTESERQHGDQSGEKMLFHCSAGIGRTGTLLTLMHVTQGLKAAQAEAKEISMVPVFSTLRRLREYRFHLVQTDVQYIFIYQYLSIYLKKLALL